MIKLRKILFESVSPESFIDVLKQTTIGRDNTSNPLSQYISDAEMFYNSNKKTIDKILKDADEFRFLGAGVNGAAYSIGDRVLKIEPGGYRAETIATGLYGKKETGVHHPMIYDSGQLKIDDGHTLHYSIMEKFEIPSNELQVDLDKLIVKIDHLMNTKEYVREPNGEIARDSDGKRIAKQFSKQEIKDELENTRKDEINRVGDQLTLKDGWFDKLIDHMYRIKDEGLQDFHAGNIGVRRLGQEGDLVFFD
jgi:hypothetical protein